MESITYAPFRGRFIPRLSIQSSLRFLKLTGFALTAVLTGCSSFNIGSSEYGCQGMPEGVQCMSTRDVYAATNDGNVLRPMTAQEAKEGKVPVVKQSAEQIGAVAGPSSSEADFVNTYVAPRLPDKPVPIRTPAQVMRIWVAPWEDTNGDLNATGYVYTEIEPRRWVIGDAAPSEQPVLRPLQVTQGPDRITQK